MDRLAKIAKTATAETGVQFRKRKYGSSGIQSYLRDVLAMANASVNGSRYIVVGAEFDSRRRKLLHAIDVEDFAGKPSYQSLANEYIEPSIRIRYKPVSVDGTRVGVFEISDCQDRPYMMRIDYSETLRRGDAYVRANNGVMKMGRRQLSELFELKYRDAVSATDLEIGFPGEIIHKKISLRTVDLGGMPSAEAGKKLTQLIDIRKKSRDSGSTTVMARLTHARLFGAHDPYVDRSPDELIAEMNELRVKYREHDNHYLFETKAERLQLVAYNQGNEPIIDASITVALPNHNAFYVADRLPQVVRNKRFTDPSPDEISMYPSVTLGDDSIKITSKIGDIAAGEPIEVFQSALRICAGTDLAGKRFGLRYALHGKNLRTPAKGQLRLSFRK